MRALFWLGLALAAAPAYAQPGGEALHLGGAYRLYTALRAHDGALLAVRNHAEIGLSAGFEGGRAVLDTEVEFDALGEELDFELSEAFLDLYTRRIDLRLGHQLVIWGKADGVFVTDLLAPLDLSEFLAEPFEDLRLGLTAAQANAYLGAFCLDAVLVPSRPTTKLPEPGSAWYPLPERILGVPIVLEEPEPSAVGSGTEAALRLTYDGLPRTDVSVLWINGFNRLPAFRKGLDVRLDGTIEGRIVVEPAYERRHVLGLTFETLALDPFVLRGEAAFHTAALLDEPIPTSAQGFLDPAFLEALGRGFLVERPLGEAVLGLERALGSHLLRVQAMGSLVFDHDAHVARERFEPTLTAFWLGRFRRETLSAQAFVLRTIGKDYWLEASLSYALRDALSATLGAQVFGGERGGGGLAGLLREPAFSFATFDRNDFAYLRLTYSF